MLFYDFPFLVGCKIILPVSGFECYLCKVFIRDENDIEDHVVSIQHLTIYEVISIQYVQSHPFFNIYSSLFLTIFLGMPHESVRACLCYEPSKYAGSVSELILCLSCMEKWDSDK